MMHQFQYGASSTLQLDLPADACIADCTQTAGSPVSKLAAAVCDALASPMHFPPLQQAVVPGDHVVVAVDPAVPSVVPILAGVVGALLDASMAAENITILFSEHHVQEAGLLAQLPPEAQQLHIAVHDPADTQQLAYLAASKNAVPIVLNRLLCDADVVLPINLLRPDSSFLYAGPHGGLCPTFADVPTQQRFYTPNSVVSRKQQQRRREETHEIAWMLGIQLTLQVIAGPGDTVSHIVAGLDEDVSRKSQDLVKAEWEFTVGRPADLVVAAIDSEQAACSWTDLARALHTALQVCAVGGTIVLCTNLACPPGPALRRLAGFDDKERLLQRLGNDRSEDAVSAWLLAESRDRAHVCLLSQLDEAVVESLGVGYLD